jgi:hypothetical protein
VTDRQSDDERDRSSTIRITLGCVALALNVAGWILGQTWAIWASLGAAATLVIITLAEYIHRPSAEDRRRCRAEGEQQP